MTFNERVTMSGSESTNLLDFAFCLGEPLSFSIQNNSTEIQLDKGENCLFKPGAIQGSSRYERGQIFSGVNVRVSCELLLDLFNRNADVESALRTDKLRKFSTSPSVNRILLDLSNCKYSSVAKTVYYEAKIMELLAVYFEETVFESNIKGVQSNLSKDDIAALKTAKKIIDTAIESAPSLKKLSRLVCINEYKLKNGFKELYGTPVHAYIIDKRLDTARLLIESQKLSVIEAALMVGYNDASYFSEKFRERFGINPSECKKQHYSAGDAVKSVLP